MGSFWNSPDIVEMIRSIAQWVSAISVIIALVFSMRGTTLKKHADSEKTKIDLAEQSLLKDKIHETKNELDSTKDKLNKAEKGIAKLIKVDASKSTQHVRLPSSGKFTYVKMDNSANKVIITPSAANQTIDGDFDEISLEVQKESVTLELNGNNWFRVN